MFKKIILALVLFSILSTTYLSSFSKNIYAQAGLVNQVDQDVYNLWNHKWYSEMDFFAWYTKVYDPNTPESEIFGERYTAAQVQWVIYSIFSNLIVNLIPTNPSTLICIYQGDINQCIESMHKGFDLLTYNNDANLTIKEVVSRNPISSFAYFKYLSSKFNIINEAHAQSGFGYSTAATGIIPIWSVSRNISYGLMVVIIVAISFMIMFQIKINPQTIISIQSAIPKIATSLILITFSYAIAGFVIDLIYVSIGLIAIFLTQSGLTTHPINAMFNALTINTAITTVYEYWGTFSSAAWALVRQDIKLGILAGILALLSILSITINSVKIVIMIIKNYAMLVLSIISGPFEIMLGTISNGGGFGPWFKRLIGYAIFYPIIGLMFFFAYFAMYQGGTLNTASNIPFQPVKNFIPASGWVPPFPATDGAGGYQLMWLAISYVIFSEIAKTAEIIQGLMSGKGMSFGSGLNEVNSTVQKYAVDPVAKAAPGWAKSAGSWTMGRIAALATRIG